MPADNPDARPLCVDLDGTLIRTDALWESVMLLGKRQPHALALLPLWLAGGKAQLKRRIADRVLPDARTLPYRAEVLARIESVKAAGRPVHLVTASDQRIADAVQAHLGVFDEAIGSDGVRNLKGDGKRAYLVERFGERGFDYAGDSSADLEVWRSAAVAVTVGASSDTVAAARKLTEVEELPIDRPNKLRAAVKALRPHQWMKNVLLFVPAVLAHRIREPVTLQHLILAFFAFSFCASSVYVLNDLLDLEQDRVHRSKHRRPLAAGAISIPLGIALTLLSLAVGLGLGVVALPRLFLFALLGYLLLTTAYSLYLKRMLLMDVLTLAGLFTYRVVAGGVAVEVPVSFWLGAFSMFFFTGLAFVKRFSELVQLERAGRETTPGRGYQVVDLHVIRSIGPASGVMAVLVFALYINSDEVRYLYRRPDFLWLICPVLMFWISRVWFLAGRGELDDDPVVFAIRDKLSYLAGAVAAGCLFAAKL
jgi:4-hydroxybenzoate polyprenyltransferase/phosphoserine phosphatase